MVDGECIRVYGAAGYRIEDRPSLGQVMCETMGSWPEYSDRIEQESTTVRRGRRWQALARADLTSTRARWLWSREMSRWWLRRYHGRLAADPLVDRLAAAILTPMEIFGPLGRAHGWCVRELARLFVVPEALVLLRIGEVTGVPVALVSEDGHLITLRGRPGVRRAKVETFHMEHDVRTALIARG
jgi:hypothetical protein